MSRTTLTSCLGFALLASCAPPPNVTIANRLMTEENAVSFQECGVSVRFSGSPREMHDNEAAAYTSSLGPQAKWQVDGRTYQGFQLVETALCVCRDSAYSNADIAEAERRLARNSNIRLLPVENRPAMRRTLGLDSPFSRYEVEERVLLMFPTRAPRCVFVQGGKYSVTMPDGLKAFFATLETIGK